MSLRYQKPPLVEALCELRFAGAPDRQWDWPIAEQLYARIQEHFPTRRDQHAINLQFAAGTVVSSPRRLLQFVSSDERTMVQVGPDLLAVNSLRPHLGWAQLRDTLFQVLAEYRQIAAPAALIGAGVRYVDRVELPLRHPFDLKRYFAVLPGLPEGVPQAVSSFLIQTEVVYAEPDALFRFRFGSTAAVTPNTAAFMLDYEQVATLVNPPTFETLATWLDCGHERIERAFIGSFTPITHAEIFQEIRP